MVVPVQASRQADQANPVSQCRDAITSPFRAKWPMPGSQEKPLSFRFVSPVPQTDTGGLVEYTKALERTVLKELGKLLA